MQKKLGCKKIYSVKNDSMNIDYEQSSLELRYDSKDWASFIQFNIKDEKIIRIVVGKNL